MDGVIEGRISAIGFRLDITTLVGARVPGTLCARAIRVPAAWFIDHIAVPI